ncbi:PRD domain-containing protein [Halanaerobium saccharolyticum]|jgi:transcriptional antiterminator|uniref:BglG family transcriptional antiterminator n=1 Tax=Halanaerobium saccharolyticum TaxID=43595 RepID=A0A2T5RI24_9FIRM|nr:MULTISPECIES: transcription antiterminator [Halanaerobium]PTV97793.1 BglG family transcriptional antiterminator [Halanaerobium saccharolyticum]PUU93616.1 MAG: transcriptional antiterminator [Halanaerobium sp.]TDP88666.1 BglG family transcriptional antiterminator [Halanaerobium saccharolyticum]
MSVREKYKVKKVFNNNVILAEKGAEKQELILIATGIGFASSKGDIFTKDDYQIKQEFVPLAGEKRSNYFQLLEEVDSKIIQATEEIINMVNEELDEDINQYIRIGLTDHIAFTLKRIKEGLEIINPFLMETRTLYKKEFQLARKAVKILENNFEISIPEGEIGFIAFHIHGAINNSEVSKTVKNTSIIKQLVAKVEEELGQELEYDSLNYARLVNHLRFALERIESRENNTNPLLENIKKDFKESYQLAGKLAEIIESRFDYQVPEDEKGYLALHLHRLNRDFN